jgi:anti-sigma factor ChrR (cupin superfamily)
MNDPRIPGDDVEFDELLALALAEEALGPSPGADIRSRVMARVAEAGSVPRGFSLKLAATDEWQPYPIPGIRMRVLAVNQANGYATLLLDAQPGVRFPAHHHGGTEECYVISGSLHTLGRRLGPGDFLHADDGTDHPEMWTEEGVRVLLVVPPEDVPSQ